MILKQVNWSFKPVVEEENKYGGYSNTIMDICPWLIAWIFSQAVAHFNPHSGGIIISISHLRELRPGKVETYLSEVPGRSVPCRQEARGALLSGFPRVAG